MFLIPGYTAFARLHINGNKVKYWGNRKPPFFKVFSINSAKEWNVGANTALPGGRGISAIFSRLNLLYGQN
jgi:hypothetical protein